MAMSEFEKKLLKELSGIRKEIEKLSKPITIDSEALVQSFDELGNKLEKKDRWQV